MNIILNEINQIRTSNYSESNYYDLGDIKFYIPLGIEVEEIYCIVDNENFTLSHFDSVINYNVYQVVYDKAFSIEKGTKEISLYINGSISNSLFINLNELDIKEPVRNIRLLSMRMVNNDMPTTLNIEDKIITGEFEETVVKGDANSTIIYFTLDKYYDGVNLIDNKTCFVKMMSSSGKKHIQRLEEIVDNGDDTITVKWVLDEIAASETNSLLFALCFGSSETGYIWQTAISNLIISEGVVVNTTGSENYYDDLAAWLVEDNIDVDEKTKDMTDEHLAIKIEKRNILLDNNENMVIQGDNDSQIITFEIDRYQDGVDISDKIITIKYINALGRGYRAKASKVEIHDTTITFVWLISMSVTAASGNVKFAVEVIGDVRNNDYYIWQTLPATIPVQAGIGVTGFDEEESPDWYLDILNKIQYLSDKIDTVDNSIDWSEVEA